LATALGVLKGGFVIVGDIPTTYDSHGNVVSIGQGSLIILNRFGQQVANLTSSPNLLDGPWGMAIKDRGRTAQVFISNVESGTVSRIDLDVPVRGNKIVVKDMVQVASGYPQSVSVTVSDLDYPSGIGRTDLDRRSHKSYWKDPPQFRKSSSTRARWSIASRGACGAGPHPLYRGVFGATRGSSAA
jgi:hypothetical protein